MAKAQVLEAGHLKYECINFSQPTTLAISVADISCKCAITLLLTTVIMTASCNLFFTMQSSLDTVNTDFKNLFLC